MSRFPDQLPPDEALPPTLLADLSALYPAPRVPLAVDRRVLNDAAAVYARQARHRRWLRWGGAGAAAAAAVLVVGLILHRPGGPPGRTYTHSGTLPPGSPGLPGDVDGDGRVDILDAFGLARKLRDANGRRLPGNRIEDVNGDGVIDEKDVDLIAQRAVRVSEDRNQETGNRNQ
jgi:hypothetical protein